MPSVPRILFLGVRDDANLCNRAARAINALAGEVRARVWTLHQHPYGYAEDLIGVSEPAELAGKWDWVVGAGDGDHQLLAHMAAPFDKRANHMAITHSGSAYRNNPNHYNRADAAMGATIRFIGADSLHLADAALPAVPWFSTSDDIAIPVEPDEPKRVVVAHSPSNRAKKGTDSIIETLELAKRDIDEERKWWDGGGWEGGPAPLDLDIIEGVGYRECRERRARAHVFVDQMHAATGGFGASAVEALAQGCAVLADIRHVALEGAWQRVGLEPPPIIEVRSPSDLEEEVDRLAHNDGELYWTRMASLEWAREYAAPIPFARYFLRMLSEHAR